MADLFVGRFQPFTVLHKKIMESMENPVVAIVRGVKSSRDHGRNPFSFEYQTELLNKICPNAVVLEVKDGYVPDIIHRLSQEGIRIDRVHCGSDRSEDYRRQLQKTDVIVIEHERIDFVSATMVRTALLENDRSTYEQSVPEEMFGEFETMKQIYEDGGPTNSIGGGHVAPHPKPMGFPMLARRHTFQDFQKRLEKTKPKYKQDIEKEEER